MSANSKSILIVEDVESKYRDVSSILINIIGESATFKRSTNLNEAEEDIMAIRWSLVILDLSMDISASGSIDLSSGHATLGGLDIIDRMSLLKLAMPTVLMTGFDSFQDPDRFDNSIMNLADVDLMATQALEGNYLGCVRYGVEGWNDKFLTIIQKWAEPS